MPTTPSLPHISNKQQVIILMLYHCRFLTRSHIQQFSNHKEKGRSNQWLRDLRAKHYVEWRYEREAAEQTTPAVYYLGVNGIRWLRDEGYPEEELKKRYYDRSRKEAFIQTCLTIGDILADIMFIEDKKIHYTFALPTQYMRRDHPYVSLAELRPMLCAVCYKQEAEQETESIYLTEVMSARTPRRIIRRRVAQYILYLLNGDWQDTFATQPLVFFVCATTSDLIHIKWYIRHLMQYEAYDDIHVGLTTADTIHRLGPRQIDWEQAYEPTYYDGEEMPDVLPWPL